MRPGERLREIDLAKQIGLSRTPIREALSRLEAEGLVAHDATRGVVVAELDYSMVTELYYMREVLEGTAARLAAQHASDVEISILSDLCQQYEAALGDEAALTASNRRFHETLYRCSHNRYLLNMVTVLHDALVPAGPHHARAVPSGPRRRSASIVRWLPPFVHGMQMRPRRHCAPIFEMHRR